MTTNKVNGLKKKKYCKNAIKYFDNIRDAILQDSWDIKSINECVVQVTKLKKFNLKNKMFITFYFIKRFGIFSHITDEISH